jgi:hypothetical protein
MIASGWRRAGQTLGAEMKLTLSMNLDNADFHPESGIYDPDPGAIAAVLDRVRQQLYNGALEGPCRDDNGNHIGMWEIVDEDERQRIYAGAENRGTGQ